MKTRIDKNGQDVTIKDELLTLNEVSLYLKVAEKTVLRMISRGEIPCVRIGGQWRFPYSLIESWVYSKVKGIKENNLITLIESAPDIVPVSRLTQKEFIHLKISPGTKEEVIAQLVQPLKEMHIISEPRHFITKLIQRETMASTALGPGAAFPHLRNPGENTNSRPIVIFGVCAEGTDFIALDNGKTYLFCLLYIQSIVAHLRILARLMKIFRIDEAIETLCTVKTREEFISQLMILEQKYPRHDSNV